MRLGLAPQGADNDFHREDYPESDVGVRVHAATPYSYPCPRSNCPFGG